MPDPRSEYTRIRMLLGSASDVECLATPSTILCQALHAEVSAMLVRDADLMIADRLPVQNLVGFSGEPLTLGVGGFDALMHRQASQCRQLLAKALDAQNLSWTFESVQDAEHELARLKQIGDEIVAVASNRLATRPPTIVRQLSDIIGSGSGVLIMPAHSNAINGDIVVASTGDTSQHTLAIAAHIAELSGHPIRQASATPAEIGEIAGKADDTGLVVVELAASEVTPQLVDNLTTASNLPILILPRRD